MQSLGANVVGGAGILTENLKDMTSFGGEDADGCHVVFFPDLRQALPEDLPYLPGRCHGSDKR